VRHGAVDTDGAEPMRPELVTGGSRTATYCNIGPRWRENGTSGTRLSDQCVSPLDGGDYKSVVTSAAVERLDLSFTCLQLHPAGRALAPRVLTAINTAEEGRGFRSMWEAAKTAAFSAVSIRAKKKRTHHGGLVLPLVMSI
jgi:hypothetical protein